MNKKLLAMGALVATAAMFLANPAQAMNVAGHMAMQGATHVALAANASASAVASAAAQPLTSGQLGVLVGATVGGTGVFFLTGAAIMGLLDPHIDKLRHKLQSRRDAAATTESINPPKPGV